MSRRSISDALAAALEISLSRYLGDMRDVRQNTVDWHSATFVGARHELRFTINAKAATKLATIEEDALPLSRGFVADIVVVAISPAGDDVLVELEVLTIAD
jgi:hypothetical protein